MGGDVSQTFEFGSIQARANGDQLGVINACSGACTSFADEDTDNGPALPPMDYGDCDYGSIADSTRNAQKLANLDAHRAIRDYFIAKGQTNSLNLYDRYYDNTGDPVDLNSFAPLSTWLTSTSNAYGVKTPEEVGTFAKDLAVTQALNEAARTGKTAKVIFVPGGYVTVAGSDFDYVYAMGRHGVAPTTAVIADPGAVGTRTVKIRQNRAAYDDYNFGDPDEYDGLPEAAAQVSLDVAGWALPSPSATEGHFFWPRRTPCKEKWEQ